MSSQVNQVLEDAMTVQQIFDALQDVDPNAKVLFTCDYGDYCHTEQAIPVNEIVVDFSSSQLSTTAYSHSGIQLLKDGESEDEESEDEESYPIVILR